MPSFVRPRSVLAVRDLHLSTLYYTDVLGFVLDPIQAPGWSFLSRDRVHLMLGECVDEAPASETGNHSWFLHVMVDGIDDLHRDVLAKGAEVVVPIGDRSHGHREFVVQTPDGHRIMFGQSIRQAMQFLALLGAPLKSRAIIELLEHWDIEVAYAFDRHSEGLPDEYQASSRDGGFQLLFDESQTLTTIFLHASSDSDFTPVDLPAQQLPDFHSMDEARAFAVKIGIEFTEGTADFVGEARTWIRLEWPSHSVHYEFREGALRLVTLSTRPDQVSPMWVE